MAKILYVTCNLKPEEASRSLTIGKRFLDEYIAQHPDDEIHILDVYRDNIQRIDSDVLTGWGKLRTGVGLPGLTSDEQRKVTRIWKHADQFIAADKYVFVTPMYNLGFPAELKIYLDAVCVVGKTFAYTPTGPVGLLKNQGKKCLHIHSSGGFHFGKDDDHSVPYLRSIMGFMGVEDFEAIVAEGLDALRDRSDAIKVAAIEKAQKLAAHF